MKRCYDASSLGDCFTGNIDLTRIEKCEQGPNPSSALHAQDTTDAGHYKPISK
jgi:hypothetical protein